jgi:hypothetical protein
LLDDYFQVKTIHLFLGHTQGFTEKGIDLVEPSMHFVKLLFFSNSPRLNLHAFRQETYTQQLPDIKKQTKLPTLTPEKTFILEAEKLGAFRIHRQPSHFNILHTHNQ